MTCSQCVAYGYDEPGVVQSVSPGVYQCSLCSYRKAYGVVLPRIVVTVDGPWRVISFTDPNGDLYETRVDAGLAELIKRAL